MFRTFLALVILLATFQSAFATGEPSTYFQIYVPPNNDAVRRDAALIVTAIYDSTYFQIIDDAADGDTDDSKSGWLMAGQSYVLYIRDNGINDDARYASGGVLKWDGDYFIVKSEKLVYASQSTNSDWQHDWVPSTDKKSIGQKFIIYAPPFSSSKRDVNVMAYENNTTVTLQKISTQPKTNSGFTDVNLENPVNIFRVTLNIGEDLIYKYTNGRDVMEAGETYLVISDKPVTVQYGALFGNERDGGGYVPSSNGSSSGELMYFTVPYQSGTTGEQEIRIVSWDNSNNILLERYNNGIWTAVRSLTLNSMQAGDWVGRTNGNINYPTVFRISCSSGKRVSVFEGNWFETGSPGTSDMATMVSAENGTTSGTRFLSYMAPPGNENNVINPFTGTAFGQQITHLYLFAKNGATVTVKDAYTNGAKFNRSFTIQPERYADCALTLTEWRNIYNGTGSASGPERPYLLVESNQPISVMNSNFNDNWMCYVGSSLTQAFTQQSYASQSSAIPSDTVTVTTAVQTGTAVDEASIQVIVQDGLKVVSSKFTGNNISKDGRIEEETNKTTVFFDSLNTLSQQTQFTVETKVTCTVSGSNGNALTTAQNSTVETILTGKVDGQTQQSSSAEVINVNPLNTSKLLFSKFTDNLLTKDSTDSWTISWVDINKDGYDDIFTVDRRTNKANLLYMNNMTGGFTRGQNLDADSAISMSNTWVDIDNDGDEDLLVLNNTRKPNTFYRNNNGILVKDNSQPFTQSISYYHGGCFADYDNDGLADLFLCNYFPTRYNELYKNNNNGVFTRELSTAIPAEANQSLGASWADYDQDGFIDLFVPNGTGYMNSLFHNEGNGTFTKAQNIITSEGGNSVGSCWGDIDNDGDLDLLVTNANAAGNFLYRNEGSGQFTRITNSPVATDKGNSHGCSFADMDNDGDLDIYISNDKNTKFLYLNDGAGNFTAKFDELVNANFGNSFGHAWSDFDRDGDLDLAVATHSKQPNAIFVNNGNSNRWLELNLEGRKSNRSAIGADIFVYSCGRMQMREVNCQSGFGGQSSHVQHFGLGACTSVDSIRIKWPSGVIQTLGQTSTNQLLNIIEPVSIKVNGVVYIDANSNGQKDDDEKTAGRGIVVIEPVNNKLYCNNDGQFSAWLTAGQYSFRLLSERGLTSTGQATVINILNNSSVIDTIWIPATATCSGSDMGIVMGSTAIRKGYTNNQFTMIVGNEGRTVNPSVNIKLKMPSVIIPATPSVPFNAVESSFENGIGYKTYTWNMSAFTPFEYRLVNFLHSNETAVTVGDTVRISSWTDQTAGDCNPSDNAVNQTYKVVGAIDPNDLSVSPAGYGPEGFIMPDQVLTYLIRFQNLGNYPATFVQVRDQLPEGMDMNTLQLITSSHEGLVMETKGRELIFTYDNIYLPDSASAGQDSEGFIMFSVRPAKGIPAGTELYNQASIQFDHYAPMLTNKVLNTIQGRLQEQNNIIVSTYPNPASDVVFVSLKHRMGDYTKKQIRMLEMFDMTGKKLLSKTFADKEEVSIDFPEWLNGLYFLKVTDSEAGIYTHKLIIRKGR